MPRRVERPRNAIWCRETARSYGVQRDRATLQRTEKPLNATSCRRIGRRYMVQRDREWLRRAETARRYSVQRNRAMPRGAEEPRDATLCRGKSCKLKSFCNRDVDRSTTGRFGPAWGRTGPTLPIPPHIRRRQTDSEYAECEWSCQYKKSLRP